VIFVLFLFNQQVSPLTKGVKEMLIKYNFVLLNQYYYHLFLVVNIVSLITYLGYVPILHIANIPKKTNKKQNEKTPVIPIKETNTCYYNKREFM